MRAHQIMTKDVITVTPHTTILDAANIMLRCHISGLPVLDFRWDAAGYGVPERFPSSQRDWHRAKAAELA